MLTRLRPAPARRWIATGARVAVAVVSVPPATATAYLALLTAVGARRPRPTALPVAPRTRFAVIVPAHDEELGIGATLASFQALDYPPGLFAVHVVADNCSDGTAAIVRSYGMTVHERHDLDAPGKGPALNWLRDRLIADGEAFDAVVVVDADTTVAPDLLREFDAALQDGARVAQGHYSVRDPGASASTSFRYAALACRHYLRPLARTRLGVSCGLYGNGMAFTRDVITSRDWSGHLVEDAELQNELLLDGVHVEFVPAAQLYAEMPRDLDAAHSQNARWERGRIELVRRYVPRHLRTALSRPGRRVPAADAVLDHLTPPISVLVGMQLGAAAVSTAALPIGGRWARRGLWISVAGTAVVGVHAIVGLAAVGAPAHHYRALLTAPRQILWKIRLWAGVLRRGDSVGWVRTRRNHERVEDGPSGPRQEAT